jgi:hypothetical protein
MNKKLETIVADIADGRELNRDDRKYYDRFRRDYSETLQLIQQMDQARRLAAALNVTAGYELGEPYNTSADDLWRVPLMIAAGSRKGFEVGTVVVDLDRGSARLVGPETMRSYSGA